MHTPLDYGLLIAAVLSFGLLLIACGKVVDARSHADTLQRKLKTADGILAIKNAAFRAVIAQRDQARADRDRHARELAALKPEARRTAVLLEVANEGAAQARRERDDALSNLAFVLNHEDVASTLDMVNLLRDNAPVIRERLGVVTAIDTPTKRVPGEPR